MGRFSLKIIFITSLLMVSIPVNAAQMQLFGVNKIDGVLSLEYDSTKIAYPSAKSKSSSLSQTYKLDLGTFILHPKFLTWDFNGDFGISRVDGDTQFSNRSFGTRVRFLRDFFISLGAGYQVGKDEVSPAYAEPYTRDRENLSADINLRLRHLPTSFGYRKTELSSAAVGHEEDSTEHRIDINTNLNLGSRMRGILRVSGVDKTSLSDDTRYYDASLNNSWNSKDRRISWGSSISGYRKVEPDNYQTLTVSESLNYASIDSSLTTGARFVLTNNDNPSFGEQRVTGSWNLRYKFSEQMSSKVEAGLTKLNYERDSNPYTQDQYQFQGSLDYRVNNNGFTYYANGAGGYSKVVVDGEGEVTTAENVTFNSISDSITLTYPNVTGVITVQSEDRSLTYTEGIAWYYDIDSDGYATVYIIDATGDPETPEDFIPEGSTVYITYTYIPQRDSQQINGNLKLGADKRVADNITVNGSVAGGIRKSLTSEEEAAFSHQVYLGAKIDHQRLSFAGSVAVSDRGNTISSEAQYQEGTLNLTGKYSADIGEAAPRHNFTVTGKYYTYIPIGVRLNLQASERIVFRSGEMINGDLNFTATGKYPIRRYMWLKDELKLNINQLYDNGLKLSNSLGFEWRQGMLSFDAGYEFISNKISGYSSNRVKVKLSRRF